MITKEMFEAKLSLLYPERTYYGRGIWIAIDFKKNKHLISRNEVEPDIFDTADSIKVQVDFDGIIYGFGDGDYALVYKDFNKTRKMAVVGRDGKNYIDYFDSDDLESLLDLKTEVIFGIQDKGYTGLFEPGENWKYFKSIPSKNMLVPLVYENVLSQYPAVIQKIEGR